MGNTEYRIQNTECMSRFAPIKFKIAAQPLNTSEFLILNSSKNKLLEYCYAR